MEFEELQDMVVEVMKNFEGKDLQASDTRDSIVLNVMNLMFMARKNKIDLEDAVMDKIEELYKVRRKNGD